MSSSAALSFAAAFGTNPGLRRTLNEDSFLAQFPVFLVADGMGGHQGGEVASAMAIDCFQHFVGRPDVKPEQVAEAVVLAQRLVSDFADELPGGAGTTLSGVVAVRRGERTLEWMVVNIGDSRTYRAFADNFVALTKDHSLVQEMMDDGAITPEQARKDSSRHVITRALGDRVSTADFWLTPMKPGERILVVSDGALEGVSDKDFERLAIEGDASQAVDGIVALALSRGGPDNITAVVIDVSVHGELPVLGEVSLTQLPPVRRFPDSEVQAEPVVSVQDEIEEPPDETTKAKKRARD